MVKPVTLLNTRDVESIEAIVQDGAAWPDLLTRKHTERHIDDSFHNYVYRAYGSEIPHNSYLEFRSHRIDNMIDTRLFGESLNQPGESLRRRRHRRRRR